MEHLYKKIPYLILFTFLFIFYGCNDNATAPNLNEANQTAELEMPKVQNNSLAFNSRDDFNGFVKKLQEQPEDQLNAFIANEAKGFTSLKQMKNKIRESKSPIYQSSVNSTEILQLNIEDPNFASIVNENGVFQIGEQVYKITNRYSYVFKNRAAFDNYFFSGGNNIATSVNQSTAGLCDPNSDPQFVEVSTDVHRIETCGGIGDGSYTGGGGGGSTEDNSYPNQDVLDLDPSENPDLDYASERTEEYRSGGKDGRLRGSTWNQDFFVFSSVGTKSIHERHSWGKWWDRTAEKITLEATADFNYGEFEVDYSVIEAGLNFNYGTFIYSKINQVLNRVLNMTVGSTIRDFLVDQLKNQVYTIEIFKHETEGYDVKLFPTVEAFSKSKSNVKKIREVFDWSTAIVSYPPAVQQSAVDYELEMVRAKHTLIHDGYHLGFITDKRK
jgi:hypothetical protein